MFSATLARSARLSVVGHARLGAQVESFSLCVQTNMWGWFVCKRASPAKKLDAACHEQSPGSKSAATNIGCAGEDGAPYSFWKHS